MSGRISLGKIGCRNMMYGGWKNPYVTDGLIAMWDGEWNEGPGLHNSSLLGWNDLCGNNYNLDFGGSSSLFEWGSNFASFESGTNYTSPWFRSTSSTILSGLSSVTFETCLDISATTQFGVTSGFRKTEQNNRLLWYRQTDGRLDPVVSTVSSGTKHLSSTAPYTKDTTKHEAITVDSSGKICFYVNGALYDDTQSISGLSAIASMDSQLGINIEGSFTRSSVGGKWRLYNLRLYSRALTAAEIAHNHAVDKARFNLPDAI